MQGFELVPSNLGGWSLDKHHALNIRSGEYKHNSSFIKVPYTQAHLCIFSSFWGFFVSHVGQLLHFSPLSNEQLELNRAEMGHVLQI